MIADPYLPEWPEVVMVDPRTFVPQLRRSHPAAHFIGGDEHHGMAEENLAFQVATIAHAAIGQRRRTPDGSERAAPYIVHPVHVAALAVRWTSAIGGCTFADERAVFSAALLHDVLEDTKLTAYDLNALGLTAPTVNDVVTLTKTNDGPEDASYFLRCASGFPTWIVKAADTTSNLMSFAAECVPGARNQAAKELRRRQARAHDSGLREPPARRCRPDAARLRSRPRADRAAPLRGGCVRVTEPRELVERLTIETPFPLGPATIFAAVGGSHAYGMARSSSDVDVRAVVIPPAAFTIGMDRFDGIATPEGAPTDEHVYSLRRFVRLAAAASVPILELLFAPEDCIVEQAALFYEHVGRVRDIFITKRLHEAIGHYALVTAQRAFAGRAHKGREALLERFGYDTKSVAHAIRLWRMGAEALREGALRVRRPDAAELLQIRDGAIAHAELARFEGRDLVGGVLADERDAFEAAYRASTLPDAPDEAALSNLLVEAHRDFYGWS